MVGKSVSYEAGKSVGTFYFFLTKAVKEKQQVKENGKKFINLYAVKKVLGHNRSSLSTFYFHIHRLTRMGIKTANLALELILYVDSHEEIQFQIIISGSSYHVKVSLILCAANRSDHKLGHVYMNMYSNTFATSEVHAESFSLFSKLDSI